MALLTSIKRWSYAFKKHLMDHVVQSLADLNEFIDKADEGLMTQVSEGDYDGLIKVMEILRVSCNGSGSIFQLKWLSTVDSPQLVKDKQAATDVMFEPLHDIIDMLRNYGVVIPEKSLVQLQELPEKWANTKRLSVMAKQQVLPLQSMEVGKLKKRIADFEQKQARLGLNRSDEGKCLTDHAVFFAPSGRLQEELPENALLPVQVQTALRNSG